MADGTRRTGEQLAIGHAPGRWAVVGGRDDDREVIVYVVHDGRAHELHVPVDVVDDTLLARQPYWTGPQEEAAA